ncbi:hypothetical protein FNV43_RR06747 [Rhamnella rubrinervis]|uniref:non-specific serine/threonine protein kinase n=1 Tax=Rhamnella rubrinervis TaxID=2594499 RepID=A0A8K0HF75_9ROSA|nr:hypothetical protein FNV43_RR06747 [Rhamnella rubrinervis]
MGLEYRGRAASVIQFLLAAVLGIWACTESFCVLASDKNLVNHNGGRRKLHDIGSSISIDCGIPEDFSYTDNKTHIIYTSDSKFIDTGINKNISPEFNSEDLQQVLENVRSFPHGKRNCYTLKPPQGKGTIYLIRGYFMYGNYDESGGLPEFDLYVGVNLWDSVKFDNASHVVIKEIIHLPLLDTIHVCLLDTGFGTPFISALELRHFHDSSYRIPSGSLVLYKRFDVGSTTNQIVRYKEDAFDRMWFPYNIPSSVSINTSFPVGSLNENEYKLPSSVMKTAMRPSDANGSLDFEFDTGDPILEFYIYMHFAELESLQRNQHREFSIELNGNTWANSIVPDYLHSITAITNQSVRGTKLRFSIYKTSNSTLPPILNAMEIYLVRDFLQAPTDQEDVNAMMEIKESYRVGKSWQGDPCEPNYWDGLNCSDNGYDSPRIVSLNLASSGLTGKISLSFSKIRTLQYLDLSNNSLTEQVPEFLSRLSKLKTLNLSNNKLSGSIPSSLKERFINGSLLLSVDGNVDCLIDPCKKQKKKRNIVVPVVATLVPSLIIFAALIIFWLCKRKQAPVKVLESINGGLLKSNNQQFTYSDIVSITKNFQSLIGKGGFGMVYHGYLNDGTQVAVKMLSTLSSQSSMQFQNEAQLLMRVHHRNLASIIGYCNEGENMGIIFEYMAYGNLEDYLSDETKEVLNWKERLQIAVDAAQGLEYLHHGCKPPIIHRDVKTANILLNANLDAQIADFGFSRFFPLESVSHSSTTVVGTFGYLDPEYYSCHRLTEKSDVYSFGVVLLQLITGHPAIMKSHNSTHIVEWVRPILSRGDIRDIVDPRLQGNFNTNSVWKAVEIAMACVPFKGTERPTMNLVVMDLKQCLEMENDCKQTWEMESQTLLPADSGSYYMDLETEMGPQPR